MKTNHYFIFSIVILIIIALTACKNEQVSTEEIIGTDEIGETDESPENELNSEESEVIEIMPNPVNGQLNNIHYSEYFSPALGLAEDYPRMNPYEDLKTIDIIERDFALMASYGIRDIRVSIAWGEYETYKGVDIDWTLWDKKVDLAEKYGIELYPYICYSPSWATGGSWNDPPKDLQDWYDFVYKVVDRYKGRIHHWELWNEGDNQDFWLGTWEEQLDLVKVGAQAVKAVDPDIKTIFGGLTKLTPSHVETIYTSGVGEYIDVINIHFYHETWNPTATEAIYDEVKGVANVIRKYGGEQELWTAEIGYSDYVQEDGSVSHWYSIRQPYEKTQNFQAQTFIRIISQIAATEDVSNILWYRTKNLRLDRQAIGDVNNYFLGVIDHDYFKKPIWFTLAATNKLFDAPFKSINEELVIDKTNAIRPHVYGFKRENGDVFIVSWNRGDKNESIEVTIPSIFSSAISYSITGEKSAYEFIESEGTTTLQLDLIPESTNIIELFANQVPARLTIKNPEITQINDNTYTVTATVENIGNEKVQNIIGEILTNGILEMEDEAIQTIDSLNPGDKVQLSWQVFITDHEGQGQLWLAVNESNSAPAGILIDLP